MNLQAIEIERAMLGWLQDKGKTDPPPFATDDKCRAWVSGYRDALRDVAEHFDVRVVQR